MTAVTVAGVDARRSMAVGGDRRSRLAGLTTGAVSHLAALVPTIVVVLLGAAAAVPYGEVFAGGVPPATGLAVVLGAGVAWLAARTRVPFVLTIPIAVAVLVIYTGGVTSDDVVAGAVPTPGSLVDVWAGVTAGWRDLLTVGLPTDPDGRLVAGPVAASFLVGWTSVEIGRRSRWPTLAVLPAVVAMTLAMAVAGDVERVSVSQPALVVGGVLLYLVVRRPASAARSTRAVTAATARSLASGWLLAGVPLVAAVTLAAVAVGTLAPITEDTGRFDLRSLVDQTVEVRDDLSPLSRLPTQLGSERELFEIELSVPEGLGPETLSFVPVAVLDTYDGTLWTTEASFLRPGRELAHAPRPDETEVRAEVTLLDYESSFLPVLHDPVGLDGTSVGYDPETSTLISGADPSGDVSYRFSSMVRDHDAVLDAAADADPAAGPAAERYLQLPARLPDAVTALAAEIEGGASTPFTRLDLLRDALAGRNTNAGARPGHSLIRLARFLGAPGDPQATGIGTSEQAAAVFALVARRLGVPARLVVGYNVEQVPSGEPIVVHASDIGVQAEALFAGVGWVRFDPRPDHEVPLPEEEEAPIVPDPTDPSNIEDTPPPTTPQVGDTAAPAPPVTVHSDAPPRWPLTLAGVPVLLAVAPPLLKRLRRWRRRSGPDARRVFGAVAEVNDRLRERGHRLTPAMTVNDAMTANDALPAPVRDAGGRLAGIVDRALYEPVGPSRADADGAWDLEEMITKQLTAGRGVLHRVRWWIDPRPLLVRPGGRR